MPLCGGYSLSTNYISGLAGGCGLRELLCRDMGNECQEVITGETDDEVIEKAALHVSERHPETELTEAARSEVRLLVHDA